MARMRTSPNLDGLFATIERTETKHVTEAIADDARRACPYDEGHLHDSIETRYPDRNTGQIWVGTTSETAEYWAATEYGSEPHPIEVRSKKVLANKETGEFFGRRVNHPGTPEQPFMRPALYRTRRLVVID